MGNKNINVNENDFRNIDGWFSPEAAGFFALVDETQRLNDVRGDIFEIGCHYGRSTFLLGQMVRPGEKLGVCDLFDEQEANVSDSGGGNRDVFMENMKPLTENGLELRVFQGLSQNLTAPKIGENHRFFHIDGGHNADEALADLKLATQATIEKGVIVVDDPFRQDWPGVTEALIRFLDEHNDFWPIVVGFNKMILVRENHADLYISQFVDEDKREAYGFGHPWRSKKLPFLGRPMRIFYLYSRQTEDGLLKKYYLTRNRTLSTFERLLLRLGIKIFKTLQF